MFLKKHIFMKSGQTKLSFVFAVYLQKRQVFMEILLKNTGPFVYDHILIWINQETSSTIYRWVFVEHLLWLPAFWAL